MNTTRPPIEHPNTVERQRLLVNGVVQGVGFRPFVYGLAVQLGLVGFVGNDSAGVFIEVEGPPEALSAFQEKLRAEAPPLAHIETITCQTIPPTTEADFSIAHSQIEAAANTLISPDLVTCDDCLRELFNPADRRYHYPFINCTNCGPRFTITRDIPYDRPLTTMALFAMCAACQAEYDDPLNRRFHAQPNACPTCGPQVEFQWSAGRPPNLIPVDAVAAVDKQGHSAIELAQQVLVLGGVVAVKGLGGFHLACDATNHQGVQMLRQRKGRVDKPFAVMAPDLDTVRKFAQVTDREAALLAGKERPIVLLKKLPNTPLSDLVAPGNPALGVMLPYTPLHYLLLNGPSAQSNILVMTSGNYSNEPIVKDNAEALAQLAPLADAFLLHNRDIHVHCDDSVIRVFETHELPIRRSRGYAPFPVKLPLTVPPVLAVGGELKSTFCLAKDSHAFMSQHIGDMENLETLQAFEASVAHFKSIFRIEPEVIACDLHPGYLSTQWAEKQQGSRGAGAQGKNDSSPRRLIKVQHHHAHIAAIMAEHGLDGQKPVIGFSFDGTGYGSDGAIWGGEVLRATYRDFQRVAHLKVVPLPGGDAAIKRPYRLALTHLWAAGVGWDDAIAPVAACTATERGIIQRQLERGFNTVPTSSMGRLFDAVSSLIGLRHIVTYEGQAAIELEAVAENSIEAQYKFALSGTTPIQIDPAPVIRAIVADMHAKLAPEIISAKFHNGVADVIVQLSKAIQAKEGLNDVALSGGVFQNITLLTKTARQLHAEKFNVLTHRFVPPNDGGLALGQAIIGAVKYSG